MSQSVSFERSLVPRLTVFLRAHPGVIHALVGARRALVPIENKRNFLDVSADIMEKVDPIFYGDPKTAAVKVLGAGV